MSLPTIEEITQQIETAKSKRKGAVEVEAAEPSGETAEKDEPEPSSLDAADADAGADVSVEDTVKEEPKKPDPFGKRFAALTRLDKERRVKEQELQHRIQEFDRRQKEQETRSSYKPTDALDALKHHGYTYDDAVYRVLGASAPEKEVDPIEKTVKSHLDPLGQKMTALEAKIAELDTATKRFNEMQEQTAERELHYGLQAVIKDGAYPYISGLGEESFDLVYDTLVGSYSDPASKQKLTYKQACDKVEAYYKRIGSVGGGAKEDTVTDAKAPLKKPAEKDPPAKTLTQAHSASTRSNKQAAVDKMGKFDAIDEVAKLIRYHSNR